MNEPTRRFFSGDTLQQALIQAANHFNLPPEEVAYRSVEKRHGFLKTRRRVVIEVDPDAPRRDPSTAPPVMPVMPPMPPPAIPPPAVEAEGAAPAEAQPERPVRAERPMPPRRPERERERGFGGGGGGGRDRDRGRGRGGPGAPRGRDDRGPAGPPRRGPVDGNRLAPGERRDAYPRGDRGERGPAGGARGGRYEGHVRTQPSAERLTRVEADSYEQPPMAPGNGLIPLPEIPRRASERFPEATGPQAEAAAKGMELILRITGLTLTPRILQGEDRLEVDLSGEDVDWCFADDGEFVVSVEHLLPRLIRSMSGEAPLVRVDCDNFQEIREERLRSLAQRVAEEVRRRGRPRTLEPMNPADRRIVHITLADDPGVVSESSGDGYFKRVTIRPA
ncbi:MAG TPA: R3H domain-containing nucleic acid-binding protein [Thermoanaerobaculia bacterium]|nr:R3H domain-containing nucleic acid-binding protein [Thermoanaerobaculia bacterium]